MLKIQFEQSFNTAKFLDSQQRRLVFTMASPLIINSPFQRRKLSIHHLKQSTKSRLLSLGLYHLFSDLSKDGKFKKYNKELVTYYRYFHGNYRGLGVKS